MNIFGKRKETRPPSLEVAVPEKKFGTNYQYDLRAALAKALLLFMLCYGAVGGFLSAYGMEYDRMLCAVILAMVSLLMGLLYETGIRSFTNLVMILVFLAYAYMAVTRFWVLNSGAYAVINKMYEVARTYLGVNDASQYSLRIEDTYRTVTAIAIFVGIVGIILVAIRTQYSASFVRIFLMTFTLYLIPLYFDRVPDRLSVFFLLASYSTLLIVQLGGSRKHISGQILRVLPVAASASAAIVLLTGALIPQNSYRMRVPKSAQKAATEQTATTFAQFGMLAILQNSATGGGVSGGKLSDSAAVMPTYKTDLQVRFTPYSMEPLYLKAFAGIDYLGDRWLDVREVFPEDDTMLSAVVGRREWYEADPDLQGRGVMEVVNIDANRQFDYRPYYTDDADTIQMGETAYYTYYPAVTDLEILGSAPPGERYLEVPASCYQAVRDTCSQAGFSGSPEEIADQITEYFEEAFSYTLRPGFHFGTDDYISYFLRRNKKGYCGHFASAGTMLFRYMGIPARYVEGYVLSYTDMILDGELAEGNYADYYSGYSGLGETALLEVKISDAQAHAWVEIYIEGRGWIVVDPTPAAVEEEDVGSFWENFGLGGIRDTGTGQGEGNFSNYLENALEGSAPYVLLLLAAALLFWAGRKLWQKEKEKRLPAKERLRLEYRRLTELLSKKAPEFSNLTTPAQELAWVERECRITLPEGFVENIYLAFYAPEGELDLEKLRTELTSLRSRVKKIRRKKQK